VSGSDRAPERAPLVEITRTEALLWLNDRVGGIVSVTVQVDHGESTGRVLLIGDAELRHWSSRETDEYLANNLDEERAGRYYLGNRTVIDVECFEADSYVYRANTHHLVIDLDTKVTLRISGHKPD
jgi:hypothetical protein